MIHSHLSICSRGVHVKESFLICNTFQAVYEDSVIMQRMLKPFALKPEFQRCKTRKCNKFYQCKRVEGQYFWNTSFWLNKLIIRTLFKHQIHYVCFMGNLLNFNKKLPYLTALTPMKRHIFVLFGFI